MKSATYILKKPHLEKLQNEEYTQHVDKIQKIITSKIDVSKKYNDVYGLLQIRNKNRIKNSNFAKKEQLLLRQKADRSLSERCRSEKGFSMQVKNLNFSPSNDYKYFDRPSVKKEQQRIYQENQVLAGRIINSLPVIQKEKQEEQFQKHLYELSNIRKFHIYVPNNLEKKLNISKISQAKADSLNESKIQSKSSSSYNKNSYSNFKPSLKQQKGILIIIEFLSVQFRKMIIQQYLNNENFFFYEVFNQSEEILRTLPLQYDEFCHVILEIFVSEMHFNNSLMIKLWKVKNNSEIYLGHLIFNIIQLKNLLDYAEAESNDQSEEGYKLSQSVIIKRSVINGERQLVIKWLTEQFILKNVEDKSIFNGMAKIKISARCQNPKFLEKSLAIKKSLIENSKDENSFRIQELQEEEEEAQSNKKSFSQVTMKNHPMSQELYSQQELSNGQKQSQEDSRKSQLTNFQPLSEQSPKQTFSEEMKLKLNDTMVQTNENEQQQQLQNSEQLPEQTQEIVKDEESKSLEQPRFEEQNKSVDDKQVQQQDEEQPEIEFKNI